MRTFKIDLLGREFFLKSDEKKEDLDQVTKYINDSISTAKDTIKTPTDINVLLLSCLNMASEYVKKKKRYDNKVSELQSRINKIIEQVDAKLGNTV